MGNWNRHFVRVGSDGNVSAFDVNGNLVSEFLTVNAYPLIQLGEYSDNGFGIIAQGNQRFSIVANQNTYSGLSITGLGNPSYTNYSNLAMRGWAQIIGTPDLRIGVTAADASAITIFSSTASGVRYEVKARILATSGSSATYTISWTEGGVAQTVALTITAVDTEVHDNFVIAPDAGTNITAQITALTSSTVNVDAIVSVLG